jgi:hypothetical protein
MIKLEQQPLDTATAAIIRECGDLHSVNTPTQLEHMPHSLIWERAQYVATIAIGNYLAAATVVSGQAPKLDAATLERELREIAAAAPSVVQPEPQAPIRLRLLPDFWDARRKQQGKGNTSRCAAELRIAVNLFADLVHKVARGLEREGGIGRTYARQIDELLRNHLDMEPADARD